MPGRTLPWASLDPEHRNAIFLYLGIGVVVVLALAIIGLGYYRDKIQPKHETVLIVGSRKFDVAFLERRVRADLRSGAASPSSSIEQVVIKSLQNIEVEEVTRASGKAADVTVTDDDIDGFIKNALGFPTGVPRDAFAAPYRQEVLRKGLPVNEYREIVAAAVLREMITKKLSDAVPAQGEQVDARLIQAANQAQALDAKQRLGSGENFTLVAATISVHNSKSAGGEIGWVPRGTLPPPVDAALFSLPLGDVSGVIEATDGFYIVQARERDMREIDPALKQVVGKRGLEDLAQQTRKDIGSTPSLTQDQVALIGRRLLGDIARQPRG